MLARRYMHEYGVSCEQLANVALTLREHANRVPGAMSDLITEGVRQLREESDNQVPGTRTCRVTGAESAPSSAMIIRR